MDPMPKPPYRPDEAARLLGCSKEHLLNHFEALGGVKVGTLVVIPRARVDALCGIPAPDPAPAVERVLALVPLLDWRACSRVIQAAAHRLAEQTRPTL